MSFKFLKWDYTLSHPRKLFLSRVVAISTKPEITWWRTYASSCACFARIRQKGNRSMDQSKQRAPYVANGSAHKRLTTQYTTTHLWLVPTSRCTKTTFWNVNSASYYKRKHQRTSRKLLAFSRQRRPFQNLSVLNGWLTLSTVFIIHTSFLDLLVIRHLAGSWQLTHFSKLILSSVSIFTASHVSVTDTSFIVCKRFFPPVTLPIISLSAKRHVKLEDWHS